jgi:hypothetical protein
MGLNDGLQRPMADVFAQANQPGSYTPLVPDVLRTTQLPLPTATNTNRVPQTKAVLAFSRPRLLSEAIREQAKKKQTAQNSGVSTSPNTQNGLRLHRPSSIGSGM